MKKLLLLALLVPLVQPRIKVVFSPNGGCTNEIVNQIKGATKSIHVQAYSFTSKPIAQAIVGSRNKGIDVNVILDNGQRHAKESQWPLLIDNHIPVFFDALHLIAHNKIIIIDSQIVIGGSFNYTVNAEKHNAENLTIINDKDIANQYLNNWILHLKHSVK